MTVDFDALVSDHVEPVLTALRRGTQAANEADLIAQAEPAIRDFVHATGASEKTILAERRVVIRDPDSIKRAAIIDRLFTTVVVEFEPPRSLRDNNQAATNVHAIKQVREQVDALIAHEGWREDKVSGVVCDGTWFVFLRPSGKQWIVEAPVKVDERSVGRFLRLLASIRREPMLPEVIAKRFGIEQEDVAVNTIREFFEALKVSDGLRSGALLRQWQEFYADVAGLDVQKLAADKDLLAFAHKITKRRTISADDLARLLFATYTYGAMLMKFLAVSAVTPFFTDKVSNPLIRLVGLGDEALLQSLRDIESGEWFRRLGIRNLCEGDFFGWYTDAWTPGIARQVKFVLDTLDEYDPTIIEQTPERVRDLMKRIYHSLLPRKVRKTLGEYYTPDWLAERTLTLVEPVLWDDAIPEGKKAKVYAEEIVPMLTEKRWLDPTCGSGTFLVMLLGRLKLHWTVARQMTKPESDEYLETPSKREFVRALLHNVNGFDLNPLAVIASRVNFLLSIVDLLDPDDVRTHPIELPIYLADSIALPSTNGTDLFSEGNFMLPMRGIGKTFPVPSALATEDRLPILASLLERDVHGGAGKGAFLDACRQQFGLRPDEWQRAEPPLGTLFSILDELHRAGQNGLWAGVAKNMFMPLFLAPVDYVVGNPPWVNWEGLPEAYRQAMMPLWRAMGLFPDLKGIDKRLGKAKVDISQLCAYVSSHRYLKLEGKLGFVITQSVFKTTGAGQGFRRFRIGDGDHVGVQVVEDYTDFQPFEDATNRTAVFVWQKGRETRYPMSNYRVWSKKGREKPDFWATWAEAEPRLTARTVAAEPVDASDPTSSWLTVSRAALTGIRKVLGPSEYRAYAGAYSGGCNPVYWLEVLRRNGDGTVDVRMITEGAKKEVPEPHRHTIEPDLLYPLLRGRDVKKWRAEPEPKCMFLATAPPDGSRKAYTENEMSKLPRLRTYFERYRGQLLARRDGGLKDYLTKGGEIWAAVFKWWHFAPYKVVWSNMGSYDMDACVVGGAGPPIIPQHIVTLIPFDKEDEGEAHYCAAALNSTPFRLATIAYSQEGGKSFGTPHVLEYGRLPKWQPSDSIHLRLSALSREAHRVAAGEGGRPLADIEAEIDALAATLWGITEDELHEIQQELRVRRRAANGSS